MTSTIVSSSSSSFHCMQQDREPTSLPSLRCVVFGQAAEQQAPASSSPRGGGCDLPSFSAIASANQIEEEEVLPLLMSMVHKGKGACESPTRLPTISSLWSSPSSVSATPPSDRISSSSPVPKPSPPSPSPLSPSLFSSLSFLLTGSSLSENCGSSPSSSPVPFSSPSSSAAGNKQAYVSATNSLMELSDIISSTPALPVPHNNNNNNAAADCQPECGVESTPEPARVDVGRDSGPSSPVSSRTRQVTRRSQRQKQAELVRNELEFERDRRRKLESELRHALRELLQLRNDDDNIIPAGGQFFLNILGETEDGSSPLPLVHLLSRTNSLPSFSSGFARADDSAPAPVSSEGRSMSAPVLPPIGSIPALSPYLKRKRASLPAAPPYPSHSLSPASSPLRPSRASVSYPGDAGRSGVKRRRKNSSGDDEDGDYDPTTSAKKTKRSRSISEGGRRLQANRPSAAGRRSQQFSEGSEDHDAIAAFIARRRAIEDELRVQQMDVVEGADQEDDPDCEQEEYSTKASSSAKRDGVLGFIKDHPHASFWLSRGKARN